MELRSTRVRRIKNIAYSSLALGVVGLSLGLLASLEPTEKKDTDEEKTSHPITEKIMDLPKNTEYLPNVRLLGVHHITTFDESQGELQINKTGVYHFKTPTQKELYITGNIPTRRIWGQNYNIAYEVSKEGELYFIREHPETQYKTKTIQSIDGKLYQMERIKK